MTQALRASLTTAVQFDAATSFDTTNLTSLAQTHLQEAYVRREGGREGGVEWMQLLPWHEQPRFAGSDALAGGLCEEGERAGRRDVDK